MNFKRKKGADNEPVFAVSVMPAFSGMYSELLKGNDIPFICKQKGAAGYLKILTGGLLTTDDYYVNAKDYDRAMEIYKAYIEIEAEED